MRFDGLQFRVADFFVRVRADGFEDGDDVEQPLRTFRSATGPWSQRVRVRLRVLNFGGLSRFHVLRTGTVRGPFRCDAAG